MKISTGTTKKSMSLILLVASYQYHILYASIYTAIIYISWSSATPLLKDTASNELGVSYIVYFQAALYYLCTGLAVLALKSEVTYMIKRKGLPPGDAGWPIMGHMPYVIKNAGKFRIERFQKYGPIVTVNVMMIPGVVFTQDEDIHWVMTQERKGNIIAFMLPHLKRLLGEEAIMVKSGEEHKRLRKAFEPAFTPLAIRDYAGSIDKIAQEELAKWSDSGEFQDPSEWALLAMRIFFVCAFGEASEERMKKLAFFFENWVKGFRTLLPFASIPPLSTSHYYKRELGKVLKEMVEEFKAHNSPGTDRAKKSVMGRLCYAVDDDGNMPTEVQLIDNLRFFLFAGFDTTKASFGNISHFLKQDPKLEALLAEEAKGLAQGSLDIDQLKHGAPILNAVLAESWRLMAPIPSHATMTAEVLEYKGYVLPKGTFIAADILGHNIMNNERYTRASDFLYQRWLPQDHALYDSTLANKEAIDYNVMNNKFRTFNMGQHMCLGGHFAKLEVRIVVTRLFQTYNLETRNEQEVFFPIKQILSEFKITKRET